MEKSTAPMRSGGRGTGTGTLTADGRTEMENINRHAHDDFTGEVFCTVWGGFLSIREVPIQRFP